MPRARTPSHQKKGSLKYAGGSFTIGDASNEGTSIVEGISVFLSLFDDLM